MGMSCVISVAAVHKTIRAIVSKMPCSVWYPPLLALSIVIGLFFFFKLPRKSLTLDFTLCHFLTTYPQAFWRLAWLYFSHLFFFWCLLWLGSKVQASNAWDMSCLPSCALSYNCLPQSATPNSYLVLPWKVISEALFAFLMAPSSSYSPSPSSGLVHWPSNWSSYISSLTPHQTIVTPCLINICETVVMYCLSKKQQQQQTFYDSMFSVE